MCLLASCQKSLQTAGAKVPWPTGDQNQRQSHVREAAGQRLLQDSVSCFLDKAQSQGQRQSARTFIIQCCGLVLSETSPRFGSVLIWYHNLIHHSKQSGLQLSALSLGKTESVWLKVSRLTWIRSDAGRLQGMKRWKWKPANRKSRHFLRRLENSWGKSSGNADIRRRGKGLEQLTCIYQG